MTPDPSGIAAKPIDATASAAAAAATTIANFFRVFSVFSVFIALLLVSGCSRSVCESRRAREVPARRAARGPSAAFLADLRQRRTAMTQIEIAASYAERGCRGGSREQP